MVIHGTQPLQRNRTEPLTLDNLPLVHQSAKIQPDSISSVPTLKGESTWKGPVSAERVVICFAFKRLAVCCFFTPVVFDKVVANRKACLLSLLKTEYSYIYIYYIYYIIILYCFLFKPSSKPTAVRVFSHRAGSLPALRMCCIPCPKRTMDCIWQPHETTPNIMNLYVLNNLLGAGRTFNLSDFPGIPHQSHQLQLKTLHEVALSCLVNMSLKPHRHGHSNHLCLANSLGFTVQNQTR